MFKQNQNWHDKGTESDYGVDLVSEEDNLDYKYDHVGSLPKEPFVSSTVRVHGVHKLGSRNCFIGGARHSHVLPKNHYFLRVPDLGYELCKKSFLE
jgi:hypothetical protein